MKKIIMAFGILGKHCNDPDPLTAEHDIIYIHVHPSNFNQDELTDLLECGFIAVDDHFEYKI